MRVSFPGFSVVKKIGVWGLGFRVQAWEIGKIGSKKPRCSKVDVASFSLDASDLV